MRTMFVALGCEQLSISMLASVLRRAGHTVGLAYAPALFDDRHFLSIPKAAALFDDGIQEQIDSFQPDVLCFSALTFNYRWMLDVAREAKARTGCITIFGGVHPSAVPAVVASAPEVDFVCVGEGEIALPALLKAIGEGPVDRPLPNIVFQDEAGRIVEGRRLPFIQDLDALPAFEKDLWIDRVPLEYYLTMTGRGCPYRCTFCFNNYFANIPGKTRATAGNYVRQRSIPHVMAELRIAKRRYGIRYINFQDDIFTLDIAWLRDFSREYRREIGVPFYALGHAQFLDAERVRLLKEAGCEALQMGIQSADEDYRPSIKRFESQAKVETALELLTKANIHVQTDHIFGLPGEGANAQEQARELYSRYDLGRIGTYWLSYFPGTEMLQQAQASGLLSDQEVDAINRGEGAFYHIDEAKKMDGDSHRRYLAYDLLFRILPLLPADLRPRVKPEHLTWLPRSVNRAATTVSDIAVGLAHQPYKVRDYAAQYVMGLGNHLRRRAGRGRHKGYAVEAFGPMVDPNWRKATESVGRLPILEAEPAACAS